MHFTYLFLYYLLTVLAWAHTALYLVCVTLQLISPGTIQVGPMIYTIICQLFFNFLLCGQETSGWHIWHDGEDYVIKNSWTHASQVNWEEDILNKIHGMKGVPQLVAAWTIEIAGSDDWTNTHRSSFLSLSRICVH